MQYRKLKSASYAALRARRKIEIQDEQLRRVGMVCVQCGQLKNYNDFPINLRSKRITVGKPCLACSVGRLSRRYGAPDGKKQQNLFPKEQETKRFDNGSEVETKSDTISFYFCSVCEKKIEKHEILPKRNLCIYCAIEDGTTDDLNTLTVMVRQNPATKAKVVNFIQTRHEKLAT